MLNFSLHKLPNGLQLLTAPLSNTKAVTVLVLARIGSRYEDKRISGISHFLEHMVFKGTKKRPTTFDLSSELDSFGATYNAFTGYEYTGFYVTSASQHFNQSLDILCDMLFNSRFEQEEIEREKGVIGEEIKMYHDIPTDYVQFLHQNLLYGDTPLGRDIAGSIQSINHFSRPDFVKYSQKHYQGKNMIAAIAGDPNRSQWKKSIKECLDGLSAGETNRITPFKTNQKKPGVKIENRATDQTHLVFSFRALPINDRRLPSLSILNNILGGVMSSRLFIEIRERRGLAYYIHSETTEFADNGFLAVSAGIENNNLNEVIKIILHQIDRLRNEKISEKELSKARENIKGKMYIGLENSMAIASFLCSQLLLRKKIKQPEQIAKELDAVNPDRIRKLARDLIKPEALNLAIVGPHHQRKEEGLKKILKML